MEPLISVQMATDRTGQLSKLALLTDHLSAPTPPAPKFSRRYEQLLRSEKYTDCVFHVDETSIKCHKLILSAASPVFEAMLYGPLRECSAEIEILDISGEIFQVLVLYIYAGVVDYEQLTLEQTIELYYSAEKYLLTELIADCLAAISRKFRFSNILPAFELSLCTGLPGLLDVCMSFFTRCCLTDSQFMTYLRANYQHVSKECVKAIISNSKELCIPLLVFFYEWCHHECNARGLPKCDYRVIFGDFELFRTADPARENLIKQQMEQYCICIERTFFRACRPFTVEHGASTWKLVIKSNRYIMMRGLILHSRLAPSAGRYLQRQTPLSFPSDYKESLRVEIRSASVQDVSPPSPPPMRSDDDGESESHRRQSPATAQSSSDVVVFRHSVSQKATKYNCDLNVCFKEGVILWANLEYEVKICWDEDAYGAEYPCSWQSNVVDGIIFDDSDAYAGSIVKGLRFVNVL